MAQLDFEAAKALLNSYFPDLNVSRETYEQLCVYEQLLLRWQKKTNLIGSGTVGEIWARHIIDSFQSIAILPTANHWVDIGSGGGFPGIIIAQQLQSDKSSKVHLVESNEKKCVFLRQVSRKTGIRVNIHNQRIDDALAHLERPNVVTARAVAPLGKLMSMTAQWLENGVTGLFYKGKNSNDEIGVAREEWEFEVKFHQSVLDQDSVILEIRNLNKK